MAFSKARRLSDFIAADGSIPTGKFASSTITSAHLVDGTIAHADLHTNMDLTGKTVLVANASTGDNDTTAANTAFVQQEIAALVDSSPSALNTLNELAAALGDDANFSTTVNTNIAAKLPLAGGTLTGNLFSGNKTGLTDTNTGHAFAPGGLVYHTTDGTITQSLNRLTSDGPVLRFVGNNTAAGSVGVLNGGLTFGSGSSLTTALTLSSSQNATFAGNVTSDTISAGFTSTLKGYFYEDTLDQNGNGKPTSVLGLAAAGNTAGEGPSIDFSNIWAQNAVYQQDNWDEGWTIGRIGAVYDSSVGNGGALVFYTHSGTTASGGAGNAQVSEKVRISPGGNVGIGTDTPSAAVPLTAFYSNTSQFHFGGAQAGISNNVYYNGSAYTNRNTSAGGSLLQMATDGSFAFRRATSGSSPTLNYSMYIDTNGAVGIGPTSITSGVKLEVNGGKIYVPGHAIQAQTAILQSNTTMNFAEQPASGNSYTAPAANKSMAVFGSNSSSTGVAIQRDMANGYPDFAVMPGGTTYFHGNTTQVGSGASNASMYATEPGYVGVGRKIDNHAWKNWSGTGNYTARLYTPIVHNESNMFQLEIDVYGYSTGGAAQRYIGGGYAYSGSSLIAHGTIALSGSLTHRLTTATHPNFNSTVVCFDIGHTNNNGTAYYNHMRWRYQGWAQKNPSDFVWAAVTT